MIFIACSSDSKDLQSIVTSAFERSCGVSSVQCINYSEIANISVAEWQSNSKCSILVLVNPPEECASFLISILESMAAKIIVFGLMPTSMAQYLNMRVYPISAKVIAASQCFPASIHQCSESAGFISYVRALTEDIHPLPSRALCRYDYANEWNNLGYGAITTDGSIWSLSCCADMPINNVISYLMVKGEKLSSYCGLWDYREASLLWFNREVGPLDSYEWRLVEIYISKYRFPDLPAWPVLLEIPYGYDAAVTMRLDCDESIESARSLYEAYSEWGIPFSLALHASVLADPTHHLLPMEVVENGGAVLSHTLTHAPNWGGCYEEALREGFESAKIIHQSIGIIPRYAVSPFHQTPIYARLALAEAGYQGCVGGIISNDPDFIMARGGRPPYSNAGFIGHTQQCMLHGDCLLQFGEDSLAVFKKAFCYALEAKILFGFLDHPFSERYQYGWTSETERIAAHQKLISYILSCPGNILFLNQNQALDFLNLKSDIVVRKNKEGIKILDCSNKISKLCVAVEYGNKVYKLEDKELSI